MASGGNVEISVGIDPDSIRQVRRDLRDIDRRLKRVERQAKKTARAARKAMPSIEVVIHGDLGKGKSHPLLPGLPETGPPHGD